ncbi:YuzB family protein [Rossellomorea aquimaris]|uniref:DUF1450 domain-containing protein n=1 Tax=Rossellomorea aquimaris TaxID=189382 RepID=UPI001CD24CF1|nr:DUF1450 domain-containing protein [Rossellomorea aquimaris]MCA1055995.1 YuzB family protein [Rossellomorea aquimaris]
MKFINTLLSKKKKVTVEFCEKNLDRFLQEDDMSHYQQFFEQKNVTYKEYECQSRCKECKKSPYALVNGDFTDAEDSRALLEKMKKLADGK